MFVHSRSAATVRDREEPCRLNPDGENPENALAEQIQATFRKGSKSLREADRKGFERVNFIHPEKTIQTAHRCVDLKRRLGEFKKENSRKNQEKRRVKNVHST